MKTKSTFKCTDCGIEKTEKEFNNLRKLIPDQFVGEITGYPCPNCNNNLWELSFKTANLNFK